SSVAGAKRNPPLRNTAQRYPPSRSRSGRCSCSSTRSISRTMSCARESRARNSASSAPWNVLPTGPRGRNVSGGNLTPRRAASSLSTTSSRWRGSAIPYVSISEHAQRNARRSQRSRNSDHLNSLEFIQDEIVQLGAAGHVGTLSFLLLHPVYRCPGIHRAALAHTLAIHSER